MNDYYRGQTIRLTNGDATTPEGGFRTSGGTLADPDVVELHVINAADAETVYTYGTDAIVRRAGTGDFYAVIEATAAGIWRYYWKGITNGTPSPTVAESAGSFRVLLP